MMIIKDMYYLAFIIVRSWWYLNRYERLTGDIGYKNLLVFKTWRFE